MDAVVNPLDDMLGYQLRRASLAMLDDYFKELRSVHLRPSAASILLLVGANPGITQSKIGQTLGIERANMVPLSAALVEFGAIVRSRVDGRSQGLQLTAKGEGLLGEIRHRVSAHERRFLAKLSVAQRRQLIDTLRLVWHPQEAGASPA